MLDYRDIVDYVLTVFHKKRLEPISEDEVIGIADIVHKAMAGEAVTTEAIVGKFCRTSYIDINIDFLPRAFRLVAQESILLGHDA